MFSSARIGRPAATRAHQRQAELLAHGVLKLDAARGARQQLDDALARQRPQVLLGRIGRAETELGGDLGARRGHAGLREAALDEAQHPGLAGCEIGHTVIIYSNRAPPGNLSERARFRLCMHYRSQSQKAICRHPLTAITMLLLH